MFEVYEEASSDAGFFSGRIKAYKYFVWLHALSHSSTFVRVSLDIY